MPTAASVHHGTDCNQSGWHRHANLISLRERGYRDALCALIGHELIEVEESRQEGLVLGFGLGSVTTNPEPTDISGPEVAQLAIYDARYQVRHLTVWRAGEAPSRARPGRSDLASVQPAPVRS